MLAEIRSRLTYANVMATSAVFIALGAGAYAAGLARDSVRSKHIKDGNVQNQDLASPSVNGSKVFPGTLGGEHIDESTLGTVPNATNATNQPPMRETPTCSTGRTRASSSRRATSTGGPSSSTTPHKTATGRATPPASLTSPPSAATPAASYTFGG